MNTEKEKVLQQIKDIEGKLDLIKVKVDNDTITIDDTEVMSKCFSRINSIAIDLKKDVKNVATIKYGDKFRIRIEENKYSSYTTVLELNVTLIKLNDEDKPCLVVDTDKGEVINRLSDINEFLKVYQIVKQIK